MDFSLLIRQRLKELGTEQRDLAAAAQVTESYISQLLTGKKAPPAPERTDIYERMETFLRLPVGKLATLADLVRTAALKRRLADPPAPLFREVRELILRKCSPEKTRPVMRAYCWSGCVCRAGGDLTAGGHGRVRDPRRTGIAITPGAA